MKIRVFHGPNLDQLGKRDPSIYGTMTLQDLYDEIQKRYPMVTFNFYQSNHEGVLIDWLHESIDQEDALLLNMGAYTHTSIAIRDALEMVSALKVEVHLSDIDQRESFRKINYIKDVCDHSFKGKKIESYFEAIDYILKKQLHK